jgi:hypothetical protein
VLDEGGCHVREHGLAMAGLAAETAAEFLVSHRVFILTLWARLLMLRAWH